MERADQKLRYARIHLEEMEAYALKTSNDEWENAHQESCLCHSAGAAEALLHEVNKGYALQLGLHKVNWDSISRELRCKKVSSPAFDRLCSHRNDPNSWLSLLNEFRNHGTHRGRVPKIVNFSTTKVIDNEFNDPRTLQPQTVYPGLQCLALIRKLVDDVSNLIAECRVIDAKLSSHDSRRASVDDLGPTLQTSAPAASKNQRDG